MSDNSQIFPDTDDKQLISDIEAAENRLSQLDQWAAKYATQRTGAHSIPAETHFQLLQAKRRIANLKAAASVPVALAVYGASQAGKSLFVGRLVRGLNGKTALGIRPGDTHEDLDFQRHLNPANGLEATAVVTRFTLGERILHSETRPPVRARLFSRCDLMKALGRGFYSECKGTQIWTEQKLEKAISELSNKIAPPNMQLRADMVEAYRFLKEEMRHHNLQADAAALNRMLTQYPLSETGYLELADRIFWEEWPSICDLFRDLLDLRVKKLSESCEFLYMPWEAVRFFLDSRRPEEAAIDPLSSVPFKWSKFKLISGETPAIVYGGRNGSSVDLALLQGIIAEIQIPVLKGNLSEHSQRLFSCADCLDIPGAISALGNSAPDKAEFKSLLDQGKTPHLDVLKRGRVGLLFEKYAEELQANAVLYVQRKGNLDARGVLPPQLELWGKTSFADHWPSHLTREERRLFVGLTHIDELMKLDAGKEKFDELIGTQLAGHFSNWMNNYGGTGVPFDDVFLIRYPGIVDAEKIDKGAVRHKRWAQAFQDSDAAKKHVADLSTRWDAAFLEDGGVCLLLDKITPCLDNAKRRKVLASRVESLVSTSEEVVRQFWVDPSFQAEENRRKAVADEIIAWLEYDENGERSAFLANWLHCSEGLIHAAVKTEKPPADRPIPRPIEFRRVVLKALDSWIGELDPLDVEKKLSRFDRINGQSVVKFASYIADYLKRCCLDEMAALLKGIHTGAADPEHQGWVSRYSVMVMEDFLVTPGPRCQTAHKVTEMNAPFQTMLIRYKCILADRLTQGVSGAGTHVPPGNSELGTLIGKNK